MNHDYTHCADYDKKRCPKDCFRGELVRDLERITYLLPVSWAHLAGTNECMLERTEVSLRLKKKTPEKWG